MNRFIEEAKKVRGKKDRVDPKPQERKSVKRKDLETREIFPRK